MLDPELGWDEFLIKEWVYKSKETEWNVVHTAGFLEWQPRNIEGLCFEVQVSFVLQFTGAKL